MNDLITILIILAAIISFLNKIFGKKRPQPTGQSQPIPGRQSLPDWLPPWLEPEAIEMELPRNKEQALDEPELQKTIKPPPVIKANEVIPKTRVTAKPATQPKLGFNIELATRDDLKKGIVLAEILGPCRARRRRQGI